MTLHLVNRGPSHPALQSCLEAVLPGDAIVLLEQGVYCVNQPFGVDASVHALAPDLSARGFLARVPDDITIIDDATFVDLACQHNPIVSWA